MSDKYEQLKSRLARISDLYLSHMLLVWDQQVMMPPGGAKSRGDQMGTLAGLEHQFITDEELGALLEDLSHEFQDRSFDSDEASIVRVARREFEKRLKVPTDLVIEIARHEAAAFDAWQQARANNDFASFAPYLEKVVELMIRRAEAIGSASGNPYDALLDWFEPGLTYDYINGVFSGLKKPLVAFIEQIKANGDRVSDEVLHREYPEASQWQISEEITAALGFDYHRGRMDKSAHPFTSGTSKYDVRLTTRVDEHFLPSCVMAAIHEAGHGMHFQNYDDGLYRTRLEFPGLAIAESQSRFFENVIGRSRAFWTYWYPRMQELFPHLRDVPLDTFYRAINKSAPSLIRVEADEVTYGLHIMLRFEIENELVNGRMQVKNLPKEWNDRMEAYLGITPPNDTLGVLQDVHWTGGFGYFPDYLLGSILASQLWEALKRDRPDAEERIARGDLPFLLDWQREHIMKHGAKFTFPELTERATGKPLSWEPYMNYLRTKYSEVYGL